MKSQLTISSEHEFGMNIEKVEQRDAAAFRCLTSSPVILVRRTQQEDDASSILSSLKRFEGFCKR
jgi:hypothetical protein